MFFLFQTITFVLYRKIIIQSSLSFAVRLSGSALVPGDETGLHQARWALGWITVFVRMIQIWQQEDITISLLLKYNRYDSGSACSGEINKFHISQKFTIFPALLALRPVEVKIRGFIREISGVEISSRNFHGSKTWSKTRMSSKMAAFRCTVTLTYTALSRRTSYVRSTRHIRRKFCNK